jgi:hypothetical protein
VKTLLWSLVVTGLATGLFIVEGRGATDESLRRMGATGGALLAVVAAVWGLWRGAGRRHVDPPAVARPTVVGRFFLERRRAPRHVVQIPVRLSVNGHRYDATLLSVGARGALLRLRTTPGEKLHAEVGQAVRIEDYPAGTLARIGASGVYVDFAVRFEPLPERSATPAPALVGSGAAVRTRG